MRPTAKKTRDTVKEIPERVDIVDVFLSSEKNPDIAEDGVGARAKVLWLQEGTMNLEAWRIAEEGNLTYVEERCMLKTITSLLMRPAP